MPCLHIKAGPAALSLTRDLEIDVGSAKLLSSGDASTTNWRGRPYVRGRVTIEDEADFITVLTAAAASASITVEHSSGSGSPKTFLIKNFMAFSAKVQVGDGQKDGPVVGFPIEFEGNLVTADVATAATGTAAGLVIS